ncbi:MAG: hypothetical protein KAR19_07165 [Bacteroidales bacterium]|nr:hypothetical protein [Bacteroidales bacterium]
MSYLGLDIGTSGCKAVIFEQDGTLLSSSFREYLLKTPHPGWSELDSGEVIDSCFRVIRGAVKGSAGSPVKAMGISSQGEAFTPVGKDGEIFANAMVSSDNRAEKNLNDLCELFGRERLYHITGHTASPIFTLFKLIWLKENSPEIWSRSNAFYCFEELIHLKLGIEPAISWPLAGRTMLFDIIRHSWSKEILNEIDLSEKNLARPLQSGAIAGIIPDEIAAGLGLGSGVKVVTGGHDQTVGVLGAGIIEPGSAMYATGTVDCFCPALSEFRQSEELYSEELYSGNLCCYDFPLPETYTTVAYSLAGGNILKWFRDEFGQKEIDEAEKSGKDPYTILVDNLPKEPTGLLALPYFTPSGTPYFDTTTRGAVTGLRLSTTRYEFMKSLLEGVAYEMRLNLELMEGSGMVINEFVATGGGAKSAKWTQLKSDILNKPRLPVLKKQAALELPCLHAVLIREKIFQC